ncbi:PREDICTED: uncharacterized protein LOC105450902 [Wasmannia auropunctata]|uniref:uncharacterized protein LOC105450902 n=1 Tax=Wasmannia auropunctata TaxID=64793 RepID=UPI0005EECE92|nr:PREDICTED: uncharacterized protein LOC105450902 [Wasmannia auropunctata]
MTIQGRSVKLQGILEGIRAVMVLGNRASSLTLVRHADPEASSAEKAGAASVTQGAVETRLKILDQYWVKFEAGHDTLRSTFWKTVSGHDYIKNNFFEVAEETYIAQRAALVDLLEEVRSKPVVSLDATSFREGESGGRRALPRIQLPTFTGKYEDWPAFRDLFQSIVDRNGSLSEVEKLHYLRTCVKGDADQLIRNLPTTEENYERAWSMLMDHYANQRLLVRSCFSTFTAIPKMKGETVSDLRRVFHGMLQTMGSLEGIGRPISSCSDLFVHLVVEMLDQRTRREWEIEIGSTTEPPSIDELKTFMECRLRSLEALHPTSGEAAKTSGTTSRTARSHLAQKTGRGKCSFCTKEHYILSCNDFLKKTPGEKKQYVEANNLCLNCFGRHRPSSCPSTRVCNTCKQRHHSSIHEVCTTAPAVVDASTSLHVQQGAHYEDERSVVLLATARISVDDRGRVTITISSRTTQASLRLTALILPRISAYESRIATRAPIWEHVRGLPLADPDFEARDQVEILLGADAYAEIVETGLCKGAPRTPVAQKTKLGWILSGLICGSGPGEVVSSHQCSFGEDLSTMVRCFWEQEEPAPSPVPLTEAEQRCEDHFARTHGRTADGRYVVRLPIASSLPPLDGRAGQRLRTLSEQWSGKFETNSKVFTTMYAAFMHEYEELRHMTPVKPPLAGSGARVCYLPHHGVMKGDGEASKIRVVFNGSSRLPSGDSLNTLLLTGPNLLPALPHVLLRWRRHRFVLVTDIEKMYRQVRVHEADRDLQRVVWRSGRHNAMQEYQLNTVTYGFTCAPFLAIRTLQQLASDEGERFPQGARVLRQDVYVDDVLTGADTTTEARSIRDQLIQLCTAGGFPLRKWAANADELLEDIAPEHQQHCEHREWEPEQCHSTLGLQWHPRQDVFAYRVRLRQEETVTKRVVLAETARLFDPLGWIAPVVVRAKILIQVLWMRRIDWDQTLSSEDQRTWQRLREELPLLENVRMPRWLCTSTAGGGVEIHGFADASERAYAAVAYLRVSGGHHDWQVTMLQAKTRVAPLKQWKTYVANRTAEIQRALPGALWHHLPGEENPADCASRGLSPSELVEHPLWWRGPAWLARGDWPSRYEEPELTDDVEISERRRVHAAVATEEDPTLLRFSALCRLLRVTAWCRRWLGVLHSRRGASVVGILTPVEIEEALCVWIGRVQEQWFESERKAVSRGEMLSRNSSLLRLTPFADERGLLRVGGRLKHAVLSRDERHPLILPRDSHLTTLLVDSCHRRTLHGGVQLTLGLLRQRFWVPGGRATVRRCIHRCPTCVRWRAAAPRPLMGDLPPPRVRASRPFTHTGVDYAGPILLRTTKGRGHKAHKAFLAVFVCLSTRAVHLEVVSDYTTEAFLAAFKRFVSRRGLCSTLYSDQGTNFVGADAELRRLFREAGHKGSLVDAVASEGVRWRFNPPAAPHFGGIWEAAVKSTKHHIRRVIGDTTLTYEEMATLLAQIEACLNSRPLTALTEDPEDLAALTPGHFLIGAPLNAVPEPSLSLAPTGGLSRWRLVQKMRDHFWDRWSKECLHALQTRPKWWTKSDNPRVGDLCLIRGDLTAPCKWPLARITAVHPGEDDQVRVVSVRTARSTLERPVHKLVLLPPSHATEEGEASETPLARE